MQPSIAFLVNGSRSSAMGVRARSLADRLRSEFDIQVAYRSDGKIQSAWSFVRFLLRCRPRVIYVFDMAASGVTAALIYKSVTGAPVFVDTGDAIAALAQSIRRGPIGYAFTVALERTTLRFADHIVVRGTNHRRLLAEAGVRAVTVLPDGVDTRQFYPSEAGRNRVREALGINGELVIGTLGSSSWNDRLQSCYGWEMLDILDRLRDHPVRALMIGGGTGIDRMRARAEALGLSDRIHFLGYVPYDELPAYLSAIDVGLSKQTNDVVGQVRTTGKLPLYMACGRFVLATRVGEAAYVLPDEMLIPYEGTADPTYPDRLTARIRSLLDHPETLSMAGENRSRAAERFEYDVLTVRLAALLHQSS